MFILVLPEATRARAQRSSFLSPDLLFSARPWSSLVRYPSADNPSPLLRDTCTPRHRRHTAPVSWRGGQVCGAPQIRSRRGSDRNRVSPEVFRDDMRQGPRGEAETGAFTGLSEMYPH